MLCSRDPGRAWAPPWLSCPCGSELARDGHRHQVASKLAPTKSNRSCREQAHSHKKANQRGTALALVGACLHATVTDIKSRASSLPQKATGAVASKLTPTAIRVSQTSTAQLWLLWERARTRRSQTSSREQVASKLAPTKSSRSCREQARSHKKRQDPRSRGKAGSGSPAGLLPLAFKAVIPQEFVAVTHPEA
jgi:hypothetical protein